jgi:hypothetical protein
MEISGHRRTPGCKVPGEDVEKYQSLKCPSLLALSLGQEVKHLGVFSPRIPS